MSSNHFSYFRVKNFKRFKDLEVKDIGQFNLVLGDNNVGKTSFLEGLSFNENFDFFLTCLASYLDRKGISGAELLGGAWESFVNKNELVINNYVTTTFITSEENKQKEFPIAFDKLTKDLFLRNSTAQFDEFVNGEKFEKRNWQINNPKTYTHNFDFVSPVTTNLNGDNAKLVDLYSTLINSGSRQLKNDFVNILRSIDDSILNIDFDPVSVKDKVMLTVESEKFDGRILLALQGDGFIALFRIILHTMLFKGKKLMIDEIDAGIHYSRMKDYWKVILQSAKENDVQIFATTHNRECMESYKNALEELGEAYMSKARTITLKESPKTKDIIAFTNTFDVLQDAIEAGNDLR